MMMKLDYLDLHIDKSQEWAKGYIALRGLAWFSSFYRYEYSNAAIFRMLDIEEFSIIKWLNFGDRNPFLGTVTLDEDIGFVVKSDGSTTVTNEAWVILTKDESRKQGYQIFNCFPCFSNDRDYRLIHIQRFFTIYFNTEWTHENNRSTDYRLVVERYKNNNSGEIIYHTIKELRQIVDCFYWGEQELSKILIAKFCCALEPSVYGLTYKQFLLEILSALEQGEKHKYFEEINRRQY